MDKLDHLVTRHLMEKLLTGDRIWELLSTLASRRAERAAAVDTRLAALEREAVNAEDKLKRLYKLIEDGVAEMDDLLKERITALKNDRDRSREALSRARGNVKAKAEVTEKAVARFGELMRAKLQESDTPARKAWLSSIVDRIEVDDGAIRLFGRKDVLEQCVVAAASGEQGVRTFILPGAPFANKTANDWWAARAAHNGLFQHVFPPHDPDFVDDGAEVGLAERDVAGC